MKQTIKNIVQILNTNNDSKIIKEKLLVYHPADIALSIKYLDNESLNKIYDSLSNYELSLIFSYLDEDVIEIIKDLDKARVISILENMDTDDAANILRKFDDEYLVNDYLSNLGEETKSDLELISSADTDTVASIMNTDYISVDENIDVKEAMKKLIKEANEAEIIDPIYVTRKDELVGTLNLKDLIIARSPKLIKELMNTNVVFINIEEDIKKSTNIIRNYGLKSLPIVDNDNILVGIITSDDAIDQYTQESDSKYARLAGVNTENLGEKRFINRFMERLPWLLFLVFLSFFTSNILNAFDNVIKQVTILVFFQTLILDMAGNIGTQSLAVTIQKINQENINKKMINKHFRKELRISIINSIILMVMAFVICFIFIKYFKQSPYNPILIAFAISISMFISLIISSLFGTLLPIIFTKLKVDPAVASGPLITTMNDIVAIVVYYGIAALLLGIII